LSKISFKHRHAIVKKKNFKVADLMEEVDLVGIREFSRKPQTIRLSAGAEISARGRVLLSGVPRERDGSYKKYALQIMSYFSERKFRIQSFDE